MAEPTPPSPKTTSDPIRTCVGCRAARPVTELVRLRLRRSDQRVDRVVIESPVGGRGAWLCRAPDGAPVRRSCLARAVSSRAFDRAFRCSIDAAAIEDLVRRMSALDDGGRPANRR